MKMVGFGKNGLKLFVRHRTLCGHIIRRNIMQRYKGSMLGLFWSFAQPLMMLCVYTFVFSVVFKTRWGVDTGDNQGAFAIVLLCGLAMFNIFLESLTGACHTITSNPNYVKKVIFPLEILPVCHVASTVILGMIWFVLVLIGAALVFRELHWTILLLPVTLVPLVLVCCGASLFFSSLGVYLRDVQHAIGIVMQILFFTTPIFYPISAVPERFRWVLQLNPLAVLVEQTRGIFLFGTVPDWKMVALMLLLGMLVFQLGWVWFAKTKKGFADVL